MFCPPIRSMPPVSWICANESGPAPVVGSRKLASDPFAAQTTGSFVEFTSGLNVARKSKLYPACVPPGPTVTPGPETKVGVPAAVAAELQLHDVGIALASGKEGRKAKRRRARDKFVQRQRRERNARGALIDLEVEVEIQGGGGRGRQPDNGPGRSQR